MALALLALCVPHGIASAADDVANVTAPWQRDPAPLLWGFSNMYNPCVVEIGGAWRYRMWFFGWSAGHANEGLGWGCDAIFHARSHDLKTWKSGAGTSSGIPK